MRICLVSTSGIYPLDIGGPPSVGYFVARGLGELGNDVTILARSRTKFQAREVERLEEYRSLRNVTIRIVTCDYSVPEYPSVVQGIVSASRLLTEDDFDVVHYNSPPADITLAYPILARARKCKQTIIIHGGLFRESKNFIGRWLVGLESRLFDRVFVLSDFASRIAIGHGFDRGRFVRISNGVDLIGISRAVAMDLEGDPKILFVGRLSKLKGVDLLLRAFTLVKKEYPSAFLYVVGDGPERAFLEELSMRLGVNSSVRFEGFVRQTSIYRYYKSVDIFVLPSYEENFSLATAEAMGAGLPVIVSDAEGLLNLVSRGSTGLVFPRGRYGALADRILTLLSDQALADALGRSAREYATNHFEWSKIAGEYDATFRGLFERA